MQLFHATLSGNFHATLSGNFHATFPCNLIRQLPCNLSRQLYKATFMQLFQATFMQRFDYHHFAACKTLTMCRTQVNLLVKLAEEVDLKDAIEEQFSGEIINVTENREVLHTALRSIHNNQYQLSHRYSQTAAPLPSSVCPPSAPLP